MQASSNDTPAGETAIDAGLKARHDRTEDIGELRLGELVGSGRHGVVVRAQHRETPTEDMSDVAVKVPADGQSLENEAKTLARFDHPHIVKLLDGPLSNGALILEFCGRGSLADRGDEPLSADEASTVLHQIGSALCAMHAEGWIHGDVSLDNIAIRSNGTLALIDFATARASNGDPLTEGTAELAGPRRTARPELDFRCLAAAVLSALPDPTLDATVPVDIRKQRQTLMTVIDRSDAGEPVEYADLFASTPTADVEITSQRRRIAGEPGGPTTREFGPRPGGGGDADEDVDTPRTVNPTSIAIIVALLAVAALASTLFERDGEPSPEHALATVEDSIVSQSTATDSLATSQVTWSNGVAVRETANGSVTYAVGIPGDLAAVGDWGCNGSRTLGVYRPATGSWFTFESWESSSSSTVRQLDPGRASLFVEQTAGGCERPLVA